ncbi:YoaK family protein [Pseudorhodoplanes sp.]|uniref:YoaK family protein n=1 Tax=Pseudorhodoplanes sp. TaxID=1934341 RepID=UPI002BD96BD8|nr:YoaK family protein [Pseudorhodoplanes sp.]HWV52351.1 YoaK family protein [Pseudorhodoplanes sp.]
MNATAGPAPLPRVVPPLLSLVAGYVDSITFLALFGFFAAQVTGSFVVAAAELVVDDRGVAVKMLAIPAFMLGAGIAAIMVIARRGSKRSSLPLVFALEALLLSAFVALMLYAWPITNPDALIGAAAGLLSAAAMGVQSTLVRLLLRGVPQTNVMTGNSTQLAIDAAELIYARFRPARVAADPALAAYVAEARRRFATVFSVLMGFLAGVLGGALAYAAAGPFSACFAIFVVAGLIAWSARRGGSDPV